VGDEFRIGNGGERLKKEDGNEELGAPDARRLGVGCRCAEVKKGVTGVKRWNKG
jgi:hypothetical protein